MIERSRERCILYLQNWLLKYYCNFTTQSPDNSSFSQPGPILCFSIHATKLTKIKGLDVQLIVLGTSYWLIVQLEYDMPPKYYSFPNKKHAWQFSYLFSLLTNCTCFICTCNAVRDNRMNGLEVHLILIVLGMSY